MSTTQNTVSIQDYIVDLSAEQTAKVNYSIVLENNTDFIVSRKTLKTEREMVILISKGLYYIKDKLNGKNESVTTGALKSFFRDMKEDVALNAVHWLPALSKDCVERTESVISDDVYTNMCRHNVLKEVTDLAWFSYYWTQNKKLFIQLTEIFPTISDNVKFRSSIPLVFELEKLYGYNEAVYFAEKLILSGVREFTPSIQYARYGNNVYKDNDGFNPLLSPKYNLQLRRLIDYLLFDLYAQGITSVDQSIWRLYRDYLDMQLQFYGKIREKYPAHLMTEHDIMKLKINESKKLQESEEFSNLVNQAKELTYEYGGYCLIVPEHPQDLVEEGISLSHCVGSYAERVISGECHILFLRKTVSPSESLVTLQLSGKNLCQAQGKNRRTVTKDERRFLERWCTAKNLNLAV